MQPFYQQQPMNMYQPQGAPQFYQPQMPQPQMWQQPQPQMMQQPQQQPQVSQQQVMQALATYVQQASNATQIGAYLYQRSSGQNWQDPEFQGAVQVGVAFVMLTLRTTPGLPIQQVLSRAVTDTYSVMVIMSLGANPGMVSTMPQQVLQELLQDIPRLQQQLNQGMQLIGKNIQIPLSIPGYQVMAQHPTVQPMMPQMIQYQQPGMPMMQQPSMHQQYGISPMQQPGQSQGAHLGYSNARSMVPPAAADNHLGVAPVKIAPPVANATTSNDNELGITARQVSYGVHNPKPLLAEDPFAPQPAQQPQAQSQQQPEQPPTFNQGVMEQFSTPSLQTAIDNQINQHYPSDINFDQVAELSSEEEDALFNPPADEDSRPMPSMTELFASSFGPNKADPWSAPYGGVAGEVVPQQHIVQQPEPVALAPVNQAPVAPVASTPVLSEEGLPDGWLYTEKYYDAPSADFYAIMKKARRHKSCPWPIGYDRRYCTRLYRYMEDGSIEQKIVGVPMDRLKHDISLLDTPVPTDKIRDAEMADFGPLTITGVGEAVKIIKDPEVTPEILEEKLGADSIYTIDKPVYALSRQEAMLLGSLKVKPIIDEEKTNVHGFETQIREIKLITQHAELTTLLENPDINALTIDSTVPDLMQLAEAIRNIRTNNYLPERALRKITDYIRDTLNEMLYADYGYAGEVELESEQPLEDELVEFIMYMQKDPSDMDVLDRIHKNWENVRSRLCKVLTGNPLKAAQMQIAKRYNGTEEEQKMLVEQMSTAVLLEVAYSITTMNRTAKQLRAHDNQPAFVTMRSERPYLHQLMSDIKKRGKATGSVVTKHIIITRDGIELGFSQAGLGAGDTFPTWYIN